MQQSDIELAEFVAAEKTARQDWQQAVQAVKAANEAVGRAHTKWLAAQRALENANQGKKPKLQAASAAG